MFPKQSNESGRKVAPVGRHSFLSLSPLVTTGTRHNHKEQTSHNRNPYPLLFSALLPRFGRGEISNICKATQNKKTSLII